jgi:hypothetical protein
VDNIALNAIIEDLYALYDDGSSIQVVVEAEKVAPIAHGWYTRVRRTGRALQGLTRDGFEHEGAPLRRSMIEHALGLHWLAEAKDDAVDALRGGNQNAWKKIGDSVPSGWMVTPEDLSSVVNAEVPTSSESTHLHFTHVCRRYGNDELYIAWLLATGHSHASYASGIAYVDFDGTATRPELLAEVRHDLQTTPAVVASLLLVASIGFNGLLNGQPWTGRLEELNERMGGPADEGSQ